MNNERQIPTEVHEQSQAYQEMLVAQIPQDNYPPTAEQIEQLQKWGIAPPLNNFLAKDMITYVTKAMGMRGKYEGLHQRRINGIIDMQKKWPRDKVVWAKPLISRPISHHEHGVVHKKMRSVNYIPVKIVDIAVRTFEKKQKTRAKMDEMQIVREAPLADYTLRVLVKDGGQSIVQNLSFAYIRDK